ncbi:hypothetical protein HRI_003415600 [Hibiscus trionum]|uniref:Ty3 transposon capsid-like protein domain-containing protein n=1 Tax=Hibiscus trionum TaxID=183268 RepID=A0A9W7INW1_HIBTR|nr:hypothetical protein HRI_003415600 [Hibiscus trionum]
MVDGAPITRSQSWQQETAKLQEDISRLETSIDTKIEPKLGEFRTQISEDFQKMLEAAMGKKVDPVSQTATGQGALAGSRILGARPSASTSAEAEEVVITGEKEARKGGQDIPLAAENLAYRVPCPKFNGSDFKGWHSKLEQYFEAESVPDQSKIRLVMLHLEGKALHWHQFLMNSQGSTGTLSWLEYLSLMRERFVLVGFNDPFTELLALRHVESVEAYYEESINPVNHVQLPEKYILSMFKNHLRLEISQYLTLLQPKSLIEVFHTAKQLETIFFPISGKASARIAPSSLSVPSRNYNPSFKTFSNVGNSGPPSIVVSKSVTPSILSPTKTRNNGPNSHKNMGKSLSTADIEDRRKKGLCFWCAEKYTPGHRCSKSQVFQIVVDGTEEEGDAEVFLDCEDSGEGGVLDGPVLSLNAMWGATSCDTMKLKVEIAGSSWIALVDSGSTHNFLSVAVVRTLGLIMDKRTSLKVSVADGNTMGTLGEYSGVTWKTQGEVFESDFLVIPLKCCDVVLGVQWLSTLGTISWDFNAMKMNWNHLSRPVMLEGIQPGEINFISA